MKDRNSRLMRADESDGVRTHGDVGEGGAHHEVEDSGLQLQDVGWGEDHPDGGQHKEEHRRQEGQEGFVQVAVFQSVAPVSSKKTSKTSDRSIKLHRHTNGDGLTSGSCRGSWVM